MYPASVLGAGAEDDVAVECHTPEHQVARAQRDCAVRSPVPVENNPALVLELAIVPLVASGNSRYDTGFADHPAVYMPNGAKTRSFHWSPKNLLPTRLAMKPKT